MQNAHNSGKRRLLGGAAFKIRTLPLSHIKGQFRNPGERDLCYTDPDPDSQCGSPE